MVKSKFSDGVLHFLFLVLVTALSACNGQNSSSSPDGRTGNLPDQTSHLDPAPVISPANQTQNDPHSTTPRKLTEQQVQDNYVKYFVSKKTDTQLAIDQTAFLDKIRETAIKKPLYQGTGKLKLTQLSHVDLGLDGTSVPVIAQYESGLSVNPSPPGFRLKLSDDFFLNVPETIKEAVSHYDLDQIELFLSFQFKMGFLDQTQNVMLLSHNWGTHGPYYEYRRFMDMGIFESDQDISRHIQMDELQSFEVNLHDGRYSPNTAGLNIKTSMLDLSFYSVVVDYEKKKAAITLHVLISDAHESIHGENLFIFNGLSSKSIRAFLGRLGNEGGEYFAESPVLKKLEDLFSVVVD